MTWLLGLLAVIAIAIAWKVWKDAVVQAEAWIHQAGEDGRAAARVRSYRAQLGYTAMVSVVVAVVLGLFSWFALVVPQLDERQRQAKEALYRTGVQDRWQSECSWIFYDMLDTPGGVLFYDNTPYDAAWCRALQRTEMLDMPDWEFVSDPYEDGWGAGRGAVDAVTLQAETLCYGTDCADVEQAWSDWVDNFEYDDWGW